MSPLPLTPLDPSFSYAKWDYNSNLQDKVFAKASGFQPLLQLVTHFYIYIYIAIINKWKRSVCNCLNSLDIPFNL